MYDKDSKQPRPPRGKRLNRLEYLQAIEDYEQLCREFRKMAEEKGFTFITQILLKHDNSGRVFKKG
jgi:uncharacterized protein YaaR (DUF327 family)